ncbi:hypothetical protein [Acidovorax sp.]|uniref:hypothetical protein n=1 Tax=Acidovorax sp. TaxID=1872122 RepID=UPI00262DD994|nr:hypothetical protein [Acidovorax sp.]
MQIDFAVKVKHLGAAIQSWNGSDPTENFADLTRAQQTVLFSRTFHQGTGMPATSVAQGFYSAALQGRWVQAETALRAYDVAPQWYKNRVGSEANLLLKERSKCASLIVDESGLRSCWCWQPEVQLPQRDATRLNESMRLTSAWVTNLG